MSGIGIAAAMSLAVLLAAGAAPLQSVRVFALVRLYGWAKDESAFAYSMQPYRRSATGHFIVVDANGKVALHVSHVFRDFLDKRQLEGLRAFRKSVNEALRRWEVVRPEPGPAGIARIAFARSFTAEAESAVSRAPEEWKGEMFGLPAKSVAEAAAPKPLQLVLERPGTPVQPLGELTPAGAEGAVIPVWSPSQDKIAWLAVRRTNGAGDLSVASTVVITPVPKK